MSSNGFPGGPAVKESASQRKGQPLVGADPRAMEQLHPRAPAADACPWSRAACTAQRRAGPPATARRG